ncbi:hypothetical protein L2E82_20939 [Cichorium intybus]|uniref:Uncharacterized protein n=1 Tax=Cichorium intybus TaxID=13427 RepID=A0ACB9DV18_CICIN|nr:hypothetical protein L2E82_20939 [Cichorium intybus]
MVESRFSGREKSSSLKSESNVGLDWSIDLSDEYGIAEDEDGGRHHRSRRTMRCGWEKESSRMVLYIRAGGEVLAAGGGSDSRRKGQRRRFLDLRVCWRRSIWLSLEGCIFCIFEAYSTPLLPLEILSDKPRENTLDLLSLLTTKTI